MEYDIAVDGSPMTLLTLTPLSDRGRLWLAENVDDDSMLDGDYVTEPRFGFEIIDGALDAGLLLTKDGGQLVRAS